MAKMEHNNIEPDKNNESIGASDTLSNMPPDDTHSELPNSSLPPVFLNTIPKSGTHLMKQILGGMPGLVSEFPEEFYEGEPPQLSKHHNRLQEVGYGHLIIGHIYHSTEWAAFLQEFGLKHVFIYRDPRDVAVSLAYFYSHMLPDHIGYRHLHQCLHTEEDRIRAVITGFTHDGLTIPTIDAFCRRFLPWRTHPTTLALTFEDLIKSPESQENALRRVLKHLVPEEMDRATEDLIIADMRSRINPQTSFTFRRGEIGSWRSDFDPLTTKLFKAVAGNLVIEMGYASDHDW